MAGEPAFRFVVGAFRADRNPRRAKQRCSGSFSRGSFRRLPLHAPLEQLALELRRRNARLLLLRDPAGGSVVSFSLFSTMTGHRSWRLSWLQSNKSVIASTLGRSLRNRGSSEQERKASSKQAADKRLYHDVNLLMARSR